MKLGCVGMKLGGMGAPMQPSGFKLSGGFLSGQPFFQAQPQTPQISVRNMPAFDYYSSSSNNNDSSSDSSSDKEDSSSNPESEGEPSGSTNNANDDNIDNNDSNENSDKEDEEGTTTTTRRKKNTKMPSHKSTIPSLRIKDSPYTLLNDNNNNGTYFDNNNNVINGIHFDNDSNNHSSSSSSEGNSWEESLAQSRIDSLSWERTANSTYTRLGTATMLDHSGGRRTT